MQRATGDRVGLRTTTGQKRAGAGAPAREIKRIRNKLSDPIYRYTNGVPRRRPLFFKDEPAGHTNDADLVASGTEATWTGEVVRIAPWHCNECTRFRPG